MCCCVLQRVAMSSIAQQLAVMVMIFFYDGEALQYLAVSCSVLQCVATRCSVLQCIAVVAVCCSVSQRVAVC